MDEKKPLEIDSWEPINKEKTFRYPKNKPITPTKVIPFITENNKRKIRKSILSEFKKVVEETLKK